MKRCPECRRDYYDDTLLYCLDDGNALLEGPASADEPATAILSVPPAVAGGALGLDESATRPQLHTIDQTAIFPRGAEAEPQNSGELAEKHSFSANRAAKPQGNVARSVRQRQLAVSAIAVVLLVGGFFGYRYFAPSGGTINSIAVLPFENRSGNADTDYLSDGMADSLIYRLSQLPNLKVSPTSSVMRYKGKETDVAQIAKELEVDAVMSGRLAQRGDDLSISVQLIDSRTKKLIWAGQYDRKMADLLATQREIATTITQKLELKLAGAETKGITKKYTESNEAYQLYLKGRYHFAKRTKDDILKAIDYYQQAIKLDPNFALAYARIAEAYNQMPFYPYLSPNEAIPQAKVAAKQALQIDATLAEAHTALANSLVIYDWNWAEAERGFKRAIELDPNSSAAHFRFGQYLSSMGRHDEAVSEIKRALELEPLDPTMGTGLTRAYFYARKFDPAREQAGNTNSLEPNFVLVPLALGQAYIGKEMYSEAIAVSEKSLQAAPTNQLMLQINGYALAKSGRRDEAEEIIKRFKEIAKTQYVISYHVATIHAALGDTDKAFVELEKSFEQRDWFLHLLKVDPFVDPLRDDPRFAKMLKRLNLPE